MLGPCAITTASGLVVDDECSDDGGVCAIDGDVTVGEASCRVWVFAGCLSDQLGHALKVGPALSLQLGLGHETDERCGPCGE
jgi:hypothetical protein